ncbi:hypothetical protein O3M35_002848 [Rhynocoris fuscipes]|uniref:Uncharacterized protein n=1 Tax=Rhynocoris fuscipes TaxID=488301 RepID=A0AAW1CMX7_9HEMI
MQLFAFGTAQSFEFSVHHISNYIKISSHSGQQNSSKLRILCPPYLKKGFMQLKNF